MKKYIALFTLLIIPNLIISQDSKETDKKENKEEKDKKKVDGYSGATNYYNKTKEEKKFKGTVNGRILDGDTKKALSYANVSITNQITKNAIEGTITSDKGKFEFEDIETGKYTLSISFVGYESKQIDFELTKSDPDYRFKKIFLNSTNTNIEEVNIKEQKAVYENKIDKIVYNPENDVLQSADDATDVLRKTPLLSVDLDGNVELRGSRDIKFLINGKRSAFFGEDLASALKLIPANEIKSIEVMTTPGAKYEGEGDAGIVNIITKRKIVDGYQAILNGSFGTRANRNSLNLTLGKGRFGMSANGGAFYSWHREGTTNYVRKDWIENDTNILLRNGTNENQWIGYNGGINMFYDVNAYESFTSNIYFSGRSKFSNDITDIKYTNAFDSSLDYEYESQENSDGDYTSIEWNTDYTKKFENNEERELSIALQISGELSDDDVYIKGLNSDPSIWTHNYNKIDGLEQTFQIDYVHPFGSSSSNMTPEKPSYETFNKGRRGYKKNKSSSNSGNNKIETGFKIINRDQKFKYNVESNDNLYYLEKEIFNYNQIVGASYISTQLSLPRDFGVVLGARHEITNISGDYEKTQRENSVPSEKTYSNFLPNFVISKNFSQLKSLKLSYNKRIRRPSSSYINPSFSASNNNNIIIGNPDLKPSITNQIELGYNSFGIIQSSFFVYAKNSSDIIEANVTIEGDTSITEYINVGTSNRYGFNYYGGIMLRKMQFRAGFNISSYNASGRVNGEELNVNGIIRYSYNIGGTLDLGKGIKFETWGFFRSPTQTLQGSSTSWSMMSIGFKKDFKNKRGSLGISLVEPFLKGGYRSMITDLEGPSFSQYSEYRYLIRSVGISFKYTFGKLNFKNRKTNSKIKNDDLQKNESNQNN